MLLQRRLPEAGPGCRTTQGVCLGTRTAFQCLFTAVISTGKKIPEYCVLPVGSCGGFSVVYMADVGVTDSRKIYFLSPRRQAIVKQRF